VVYPAQAVNKSERVQNMPQQIPADNLENSIDLNNLAHIIAAEMLQNHLAQ
jgi:hypothetical protein